MRIAVLGATGQTGRELTRQALTRGHEVIALARNPARLADLKAPGLSVARADVTDPASVCAAVETADVLVSGLGVSGSDRPDTLVAGAEAAVASGVGRIVWLGALGTGASRRVAGPLLGPLLRLVLRRELPAKTTADGLVVARGHTVIHAGRLTNKPAQGGFALTRADQARPRLVPPSVARADVAALMLDEAEADRFSAQTVVALPA